jgi:SagB-type dehydrogenase family enzyme
MPGTLTRREFIGGFSRCLIAFFLAGRLPARKAWAGEGPGNNRKEVHMKLIQPKFEGEMSLERTIRDRRTIRSFRSDALTQEQFSQVLWAAQGITEDGGFKRAAPSAGALFPMDIYAVLGKDSVKGFKEGVYHYEPGGHAVSLVSKGDARNDLARASLSQMWMARAPLNLVITAEYNRITLKYGKRGVRYAMIEAGHIGQNIFLQAEGLGLGAGIVGAYDDEAVIRVMEIPRAHEPLLIMPVGHKR